MKKSIFAASLLIAGVAMADSTTVETSYVIGVFPLAISAGETTINVPWVESGSGEDVAASNLVKTAGLKLGDYMLWYDTGDSEYHAWVIADDNSDDIKEWKAVTTITGLTGRTFVAPDAKCIKKGQALIINAKESTTIYIVGQYAAGNGSSISVGTGYTLFAPPIASTDAYPVSNLEIGGTPSEQDEIRLADGGILRYRKYPTKDDGYKWIKFTSDNNWQTYSVNGDNPTIPGGKGAWYVNRGGTNITISFK